MLGSALYYPHIDIHDPTWLRSAVLFWDSVQTIAPHAVKRPYQNKDTKILWQEGFLEPLRCDLHPELLDTLGRRVVSLMEQEPQELTNSLHSKNDPNAQTLLHSHRIGRKLTDQFRKAHIHPEKLSPELKDFALRSGLARMHPEKFSYRFREILEEMEFSALHPEKISPRLQYLLHQNARMRDDEGEWILVDSRFAATYMAALAALLAKESNTSALTNEDPSLAVNLHTLLEEVKPSNHSDKRGAIVSFVMEAMRIDPETPIEKLIQFRRSRENQFSELAAQFEDLSSRIVTCESARELEEQAKMIYSKRIRPKLESLKNEMNDNLIQSVWDGVQRAVTISVPAGGAIAYFTGFNGTTLLAAGAAIAITDLTIKSHLASRKARRASPYTYLLDVQNSFSLKFTQ